MQDCINLSYTRLLKKIRNVTSQNKPLSRLEWIWKHIDINEEEQEKRVPVEHKDLLAGGQVKSAGEMSCLFSVFVQVKHSTEFFL